MLTTGYKTQTTAHTKTVTSIEPTDCEPPIWEVLIYLANPEGQSELIRVRVEEPSLSEILRAADLERARMGGLAGYVTSHVFQFSRWPLTID